MKRIWYSDRPLCPYCKESRDFDWYPTHLQCENCGWEGQPAELIKMENCINCSGYDPLREYCDYHEIDLTRENVSYKMCVILGMDDLWSDEL